MAVVDVFVLAWTGNTAPKVTVVARSPTRTIEMEARFIYRFPLENNSIGQITSFVQVTSNILQFRSIHCIWYLDIWG